MFQPVPADETLCPGHEIPIATDDQRGVYVLHGGDERLKAAAFIHRPLVEQETAAGQGDPRWGQGSLVKYRDIADDGIFDVVEPAEFGGDDLVDGIAMGEAGNTKSFDLFPHFINKRPGDDLLHFAEQLVRIVKPGDTPDVGNEINRQDGIEIDGADAVAIATKLKSVDEFTAEDEDLGQSVSFKMTDAKPAIDQVFSLCSSGH